MELTSIRIFVGDMPVEFYADVMGRPQIGVPTHGVPEHQPWDGIFPHADDPSGNAITFLQRPKETM